MQEALDCLCLRIISNRFSQPRRLVLNKCGKHEETAILYLPVDVTAFGPGPLVRWPRRVSDSDTAGLGVTDSDVAGLGDCH
jgi:hypothetical protein